MVDLIPLEVLDPIEEGVVLLDGVNVVGCNKKAEIFGFKIGTDILGVFSTHDIDGIVEDIIERKSFKRSVRAYFFELGTFKDVSLDYNAIHSVLIIRDVSKEKELRQAKQEFVISVSHELFNPISALKGNVLLLRDLETDEAKLEIIDKMWRTLERIERIIKQLKIIAMAELNLYKPKIQPVDPEKVFSEVVSELSEKIREKNINLEFESDTDVLETDGFIFYTIMRNLVSNAVKYSNHGGKVSIIVKDGKLVVRDHGVGIREEEKSRIFERFFRGTEAKKMAGGSGLGLSVVKHLCALMGYKIEFSSKWLVGSEFVVRFSNRG